MTNNPLDRGAKFSFDECSQSHDEATIDRKDADPTAAFPQWSRSLLLMLDYAIIEGLQHDLHGFVEHLKLAEAELATSVRRSLQQETTDTPPSKRH